MKLYWPWIKVGGILLVACLWSAFVYRQGGASERAACAEAESARNRAALATIKRMQREAYKADEALQKALKRPKAAPKIDEVVNANPSGCGVPKPVGDRLRDEIARGNAALSG